MPLCKFHAGENKDGFVRRLAEPFELTISMFGKTSSRVKLATGCARQLKKGLRRRNAAERCDLLN
jgi:hypothetical protein